MTSTTNMKDSPRRSSTKMAKKPKEIQQFLLLELCHQAQMRREADAKREALENSESITLQLTSSMDVPSSA